jgi:hypothetical protein
LDPEDPNGIAGAFGIAHQLVREIEYMNDEAYYDITPEKRWQVMRAWVAENLLAAPEDTARKTGGEA